MGRNCPCSRRLTSAEPWPCVVGGLHFITGAGVPHRPRRGAPCRLTPSAAPTIRPPRSRPRRSCSSAAHAPAWVRSTPSDPAAAARGHRLGRAAPHSTGARSAPAALAAPARGGARWGDPRPRPPAAAGRVHCHATGTLMLVSELLSLLELLELLRAHGIPAVPFKERCWRRSPTAPGAARHGRERPAGAPRRDAVRAGDAAGCGIPAGAHALGGGGGEAAAPKPPVRLRAPAAADPGGAAVGGHAQPPPFAGGRGAAVGADGDVAGGGGPDPGAGGSCARSSRNLDGISAASALLASSSMQ
jgi:hypothetical protein